MTYEEYLIEQIENEQKLYEEAEFDHEKQIHIHNIEQLQLQLRDVRY